MMKIYTKYTNIILVVTATVLSFFTIGVNSWNRFYGATVGGPYLPTYSLDTAFLIFIITLLVLYITPFILALFVEKSENNKKWPILVICIVIVGLLIFYFQNSIINIFPFTIYHYVNSVVEFLSYICIVIAYSFVAERLVNFLRKKQWDRIFINSTVILIIGCILLVANWAMVYFE